MKSNVEQQKGWSTDVTFPYLGNQGRSNGWMIDPTPTTAGVPWPPQVDGKPMSQGLEDGYTTGATNNGPHWFTMFEGVDGGMPIKAFEEKEPNLEGLLSGTGSMDLDMQVVFTYGYVPYGVKKNCDYGGNVKDNGDFNDYEAVAYRKSTQDDLPPVFRTAV